MKQRTLLAASVAALSIGITGASAAFSLPHWLGGTDQAATARSAPAAPEAQASLPLVPTLDAQGLVPDYRAIVNRYGPAVVGVTVSGLHKLSADEQDDSPELDPFLQFFRGMPGFRMPGRGAQATPFRGQGSGFIVSADGLILTNAHVVREAREVTVHLSDRREFPARVLGADPVTDIAVLRIEAQGLPSVRLGDPSRIKVGDRVLAIGAPYGLEQTATQGIVSAKGRSLPGDLVVPFLQTDAAVNPGNSGGPLFNGQGEVVGINAQIYSESGGFQGLSFAIPIDVALKVKEQIVASGKASHAWLGVSVQDLTQPLAESFGLPAPDGALVSQVLPGSAAARHGLHAGDVITEVNGEPVLRSGQLSSLIGMSRPGELARLKVWREHGWKTLEVKLGGMDDQAEASLASDKAGTTGLQLGLALRPLKSTELRALGITQGLQVESASGPAARAGVVSGDILLAVNGQPATSVDKLRQALGAKPKTVALLILRGQQQIFMPVALS